MATLVTGGTGFIGANVVRRLVAESDETVVVLDLRGQPTDPSSPLTELGDRVEYVIGSVTDLPQVLRTIKDFKIDGVVHMAGLVAEAATRRPVEALEVNVMGTANMLEAARIFDLRRVLVVSSSAVMGAPDDLVTPRMEEEIVLPATGIYPLSKLTAEMLTHTYRELYGVDATSVRPRTVYGPGAHPSPMPVKSIVESVCRGEDLIREAGSDTQFDLTYVKDEAMGMVAALKAPHPIPNYVYNLSNGENIKLAVVFSVLTKLFPSVRIEVGEGLWGGVASSGRQHDLTYRSSQRPPQDISRARSDFGYAPKWPVERAIPDYVRWIQQGEYGDLD